jgi:hypothetical protein
MVITLQVCALCGYQNKQELMPDITLTDWFLLAGWKEFTARYELSAFVQIRFIFRELK